LLTRCAQVLTRFKQGQDEVEQGAVATDYGNAGLIPLCTVKNTNGEIKVRRERERKRERERV
jgi:hypothetical protein